jgi:ketosteroid isomerase-like protein
MTDDRQQEADRTAIIQTVSRLAQAQDNRDFEAYESCFTETILIDQPMIPNWQPKQMSAREWTQIGLTKLAGFDLTHHRLFNHVIEIDGDEATCIVDLDSTHLFTEDGQTKRWDLGGRYHLRLKRLGSKWLISERALHVRYQLGDLTLIDKALSRAEAQANDSAQAVQS